MLEVVILVVFLCLVKRGKWLDRCDDLLLAKALALRKLGDKLVGLRQLRIVGSKNR